MARLFIPLAFTKTFAMAARRCLRQRWCRPALMVIFVRGPDRPGPRTHQTVF